DFPDIPIPTFDEFYASDGSGYEAYFFTGEKPLSGRGFIIRDGENPVGFISYCNFHLTQGISELDIWLSCEANCGKGYGTDALVSLGDYLHEKMDINTLIIAPSGKNTRAIRAYEKVGFQRTDLPMSAFLRSEYISLYGEGDYGADGTVILVKKFESQVSASCC
ncbi:MAG: GNAT family N-acetyltransferase, partial [Bacteroidales bacterium]|nr:GNAT family N-acetyltransferase [Bacteroidales bacterium]